MGDFNDPVSRFLANARAIALHRPVNHDLGMYERLKPNCPAWGWITRRTSGPAPSLRGYAGCDEARRDVAVLPWADAGRRSYVAVQSVSPGG